jgi:Domain of unknown function DUF.
MTLFDPGLQPERTELAWRRTSLALALGALVSMRILPDALGSIAWVIPGAAGLVVAALIWYAGRHRYDRVNDAVLADGDRAALPDGRLIAATAVFVCAGALAALAVVISVALRA